MNDVQDLRRGWTVEQDGRFFRITSGCFSPSFCYGASVLLASYDADDEVGPMQPVNDPQLHADAEDHFIFQPST